MNLPTKKPDSKRKNGFSIHDQDTPESGKAGYGLLKNHSPLESKMYTTSVNPMNIYIKLAGASMPVELTIIELQQGRTTQ
ncbi:hypothetical protein [Pseudomonas moorei]|jgi:hypothetical protein|uniref:hypothetical protein n=1 Tax=Pseudomonas moorei TaxID=395599 RepID=UPI001113DF35|nr:hypothetical protein [Pseudomonas moorei]KAB0498493.1 hypothetical protein F7R06_24920 [Pseudomonas moorei]